MRLRFWDSNFCGYRHITIATFQTLANWVNHYEDAQAAC